MKIDELTELLDKEDTICDLKKQIILLKDNVKELESVAESWMNDYNELKNKYEPDILIESNTKDYNEKR